MTRNLRRLIDLIQSNLLSTGFTIRVEAKIARKIEDHSDMISFTSRKDRTSGAEVCSVFIGMSFPRIQSFLGDDETSSDLIPTFAAPVHIFAGEFFREWNIELESIEKSSEEILRYVKIWGFMVFDSIPNTEALIDKMMSNYAVAWPGLGHTRRDEILTCALMLTEGKLRALAFLMGRIEANENALFKYRYPLKRLLDKITLL